MLAFACFPRSRAEMGDDVGGLRAGAVSGGQSVGAAEPALRVSVGREPARATRRSA